MTNRSLPLRTNVCINRRLNAAEEQRLFTMETVPNKIDAKALCFEGQIEGWLTQEDIGWLIAGLRMFTHIGGSKARGLGRVKLARMALEVYNKAAQQWQPRNWEDIPKEVVSRGAA